MDYQQRQRRDAAREVAIEDESPLAVKARSALSQVILNEEITRLEAALETLSPAHRDIILLRKFEELTFPEIAKRLGKARMPAGCCSRAR